MTNDKHDEAAREFWNVWCTSDDGSDLEGVNLSWFLDKLAAALRQAAADERERCAKIADTLDTWGPTKPDPSTVAIAIRALGEI